MNVRGLEPLEFRVLGQLEVLRHGRSLDLAGPKQRAVLAMLVLEANRVVSLDRLVDQLWAGTPTAGATCTLHAYICRLRGVLEPARRPGTPAEVLVTVAPGYELRIDPWAVDSVRFERLVEEGRMALAQGEPAQATQVLGQALWLWRGRALADLADASFAAADVARLEELRVAATEDRVEADLALGHHRSLVADLERLVAAYPLRERLRGQLMVALYRCGRQAEALRAYQGARRALREEFGLEPGPALKALERAILVQDHSLDWHPPLESGLAVETVVPLASGDFWPAPRAKVASRVLLDRVLATTT